MKNSNNLEKTLRNLGSEKTPHRIDQVTEEVLSEFRKSLTKPKTTTNWRIIMNNRITKLATAAVIIIVAGFGIYFVNESVTPAYAIEQTIEANHTIRTIHMRIWHGAESDEGDEFTDCWIRYNGSGLV